MPEVARKSSRWTADEAEHLLGCQDCGDEWRLVGSAVAMGHGVESRVNVDQVAERVIARLRESPVAAAPGRPWVRRAVLPLAAAAALVSAVWFGWPASEVQEEPTARFAVLPELDDLDETELESMVEVFTGTEADPLRPLDAAESLGDLSDAELESLLRFMEG
ncbi:MAG TPA: hypothetical protein VMK53_00340 [Gemmatimonadales bacterium]|nr:hypothetical protein [Gemmatimonadales bacterium]